MNQVIFSKLHIS